MTTPWTIDTTFTPAFKHRDDEPRFAHLMLECDATPGAKPFTTVEFLQVDRTTPAPVTVFIAAGTPKPDALGALLSAFALLTAEWDRLTTNPTGDADALG